MVMNDDEAQRCLDLAKQKFRAGDLDGAIKFARKAQSLSPNLSEEATDYIEFLQIAQQRAAKEEARSNASSSSSASPSPKPPPPQQEGVRHRAPKHAAAGSGSESASTPSASGGAKEYTSSQVEAVKEVLKVRHDYYKCLGVEKTVDEITLKKAYRKKALLFHPDKNGAPGADEAFKVISRAWEVLSDETLKRRYDQTGVDPGSRQSMAGPGGGGGPGGMYGPGMQFEGAMSPEDLFNLFFGAGGPGGFQTFSAGPGFHFRVHRPGGGRRQHPGQQQQEQEGGVSWTPLLPLFFLLFFSLLSAFFSGPSAPMYSLSRSPPYTVGRTTGSRGVHYFIDPSTFPYTNIRDRTDERKLKQFEHDVEVEYVRTLQQRCQYELERKRAAIQAARGLFSVDQERLAAAQAMKLENCEELQFWR